MAAPSVTLFKKTPIRISPKVLVSESAKDITFWNAFEFPVTKKEYGPIKDVQFSPVEPYHYAIASSTRVQVYSCESNQIVKTFSKFKEAVHCARYRQDGSLLVAGTEAGLAKVYDIERKLCLRMLKGHTSAIHSANFLYDGYRIVTCSDDQSLLLWDLASGKSVMSFTEHQDNVRSSAVSPANKDFVLTGSYDNTAKLFDVRTQTSVQTVDHGAPIEDVIMFKSGTVYLTAGGNSVRVWDSLAGGKLIAELINHHKTVTKLCFMPDYTRLLTAGLDRHVKVYDTSTYQVVHTLDFPAPVLSIGLSADNRSFAAGMSDGMLSVRRKKIDGDLNRTERRSKAYKFKVEQHTVKPSQDAHIIQHKRKEYLAKYDSYLKSFQHSKALDAALETKVRLKQPEVAISLMEELIRRDTIKSALAGRDEESLNVILRFISKHIANPNFNRTLLDVVNALLDIYSEFPERLRLVAPRLMALSGTVTSEIKYEEQLLQILGTMDAILSMSSTPTDTYQNTIPVLEADTTSSI